MRNVRIALFAAAALVGSQAVSVASADSWWRDRPVASASAPAAQQTPDTLRPFEATGLPAGQARGIPQHAMLPAGLNLKHVHGGPSYVYVLSGSVEIIDSDGSSTTYRAGDFFWEAVGHVHTARTEEPAELFILRFLAPGAEGTVPAT